MRRIVLILLVCALASGLYAQYNPNSGIYLIEPITLVTYPDHGFEMGIKLTDTTLTIEADSPFTNTWTNSQRTIHPKNSNGDLTNFIVEEWVDSTSSWSGFGYNLKYTYDNMQRRTFFQRSLIGGAQYNQNFTYTYDIGGNLEKITTIDSFYVTQTSSWFTASGEMSISYSNGKMSVIDWQKAGFGQTTLEPFQRINLSYDNNGNVSSIVSYQEDNGGYIEDERWDYTWDSNARMTSCTTYVHDGSSWNLEDDTYLYSYDANGRLSVVTNKDYDKNEEEITTYSYDAQGDYESYTVENGPLGGGVLFQDNKGVFVYDSNKELLYIDVFEFEGPGYTSNPSERIMIKSMSAQPSAPNAPGNLRISQRNKKAGKKLELRWVDNSDNESGFIIHRSTDNVNFAAIDSVGMNDTVFVDSSLTASTDYYYYVTAYNAAGESSASNTASGRVEPTSIGGISIRQLQTRLINANELLIQTPESGTLRIIDCNGRTYFETRVSEGSSQIDLHAYPKGVYILMLQGSQFHRATIVRP